MDDLDKPLDLLGDDLQPFPAHRSTGAPRPSRFHPKIKGKVKSEPSTNPAPLPETLKNNDDVAMAVADDAMAPASDPMEVDPAAAAAADDDDDEGEDMIVREFKVFFNPAPLDEETLLYVLQYPLRSSWRPFDLNDKCMEVRLKPKQSKMEIDLKMETQSENFDPDVHENSCLEKQTLTSSTEPSVIDYAVGMLKASELHLNPVHEVVQFRTSMSHVCGVQKKKHGGHSQELSASAKKIEDSSKSSTRQLDKKFPEDLNESNDAEPWVQLDYHGADSHFSCDYQQKMEATRDDQIQFTMTPSDYVNSLCPGTSSSKIVNRPRMSDRVFQSLPLEQRVIKWLKEGSQVNRFNALKHLCPANSSEEILEVLQRHACLVQGLWVSKSSLLYAGRAAAVRDYILLKFSKDRKINKEALKDTKASEDFLKSLMRPLATERTVLKDWKFKVDTDETFKKEYPDIVEKQNSAWSNRDKDITDLACATPASAKNSQNPSTTKKVNNSGKVEPGPNRGKDGPESSAPTSISKEAREALPKALCKLFQQQKVHSLNSITRELRDAALKKSSQGKDDQEKEIFVNAANGVCAPLHELKAIISSVAVEIHGVYVPKSIGKEAIDPLRNVIIKLFREKEPKAKLKKQEIVDAAKLSLKKNFSDSEYNQVMSELCVSSKGSWVLKSVD